jgi:hypothetical protein
MFFSMQLSDERSGKNRLTQEQYIILRKEGTENGRERKQVNTMILIRKAPTTSAASFGTSVSVPGI